MADLYPQVEPDEEVAIEWRTEDYKMACCDCNLVHRLSFRVDGDTLYMWGVRDNRATAQLRCRGQKVVCAHCGGNYLEPTGEELRDDPHHLDIEFQCRKCKGITWITYLETFMQSEAGDAPDA